MPGNGRVQRQTVNRIQWHELRYPMILPLNGVPNGGNYRLEHQLNDTDPRRRGIDLQDEQAALNDNIQACLLGGLPARASHHRLPRPGAAAGQYPIAVIGIVRDGTSVNQQHVIAANHHDGTPQVDQ
ncbi:MAG: hypothetical protein WCG47_13130 [Dermatophilaceae bacterium]